MAFNLPKLSILLFLLIVVNPFPFVEPRALEASANPFAKTLQNLRGVYRGQKAKGVGELRSYLQHLGHLTKGNASNDNFDENVESALKNYQSFHHLNATGEVDDETIKTMSLPRCGLPDIMIHPNPNPWLVAPPENYSFFPGAPRWSKWALTYAHTSSASVPINMNDVRLAMQRAKQTWAAVTRFRFTEVGRPPADIVYGFHRGAHGDPCPFDGPGQVLAHAFAPPVGWHHYDADERWTTTGGGGVDLETVALHEMGHILGLDHSNVPSAVMFPTIQGVRRALSQDDINGIRALYGL